MGVIKREAGTRRSGADLTMNEALASSGSRRGHRLPTPTDLVLGTAGSGLNAAPRHRSPRQAPTPRPHTSGQRFIRETTTSYNRLPAGRAKPGPAPRAEVDDHHRAAAIMNPKPVVARCCEIPDERVRTLFWRVNPARDVELRGHHLATLSGFLPHQRLKGTCGPRPARSITELAAAPGCLGSGPAA